MPPQKAIACEHWGSVALAGRSATDPPHADKIMAHPLSIGMSVSLGPGNILKRPDLAALIVNLGDVVDKVE